jgi:predicted transglutaminase-like cysteine proteinase
MAAYTSSGTIAALASLFVFAPLATQSGIETRLPTIQHAAPSIPDTKPTFPEPRLRTLELPLTEPFIGFKGSLNPVTIAEDDATTVTMVALATTRTEVSPSAPPSASAAMTDVVRPALVAPQLPEAAEEFPGAVPVSVPRLAANPKWRRVIEEHPQARHGTGCAGSSDEDCANRPWARWNDLVRKVSALEGEERLQAVNEGINALIAYASDDEVYGVGDYWATLEESMSRGRGDCEDIAIAKMWLLNAAGIDLSSMRLVVLKDTLRNLDHAVLSVVENGHQYVLDNAAWKVGRADWMRGYRPIYALSSEQSWIYGMRVPSVPPLQVAQSEAPHLPQ